MDVVRVDDLSPHIDIDGIQQYSINQHKVIFLHARDIAAPSRTASSNMSGCCNGCNCQLMDSGSIYCSLGCNYGPSGQAGQPEERDTLAWPAIGKRSRYNHPQLQLQLINEVLQLVTIATQGGQATPEPGGVSSAATRKKTKGHPNRSNLE